MEPYAIGVMLFLKDFLRILLTTALIIGSHTLEIMVYNLNWHPLTY